MSQDKKLLLLSDGAGGIAADLDVLYPSLVDKLNFATDAHGPDVLGQYDCVITAVTMGANLAKLDYAAVREYARGGGQVISCLCEYAADGGLHFSKTHVADRVRPGLRIEADSDVTAGLGRGDELWWYGTVSSAPDQLYSNQMVQRQVMGVRESEGIRILATSTLNGGAVMVEERVGSGRIVAMDLLSPIRPFYNSWGSTNKYLFVGNIVNGAVHYGRHYPRKLCYDDFVRAMHALALGSDAVATVPEGVCSDGRMMWSFEIGDRANPTIYLGAAIHGWEWENCFGLLRLAELLANETHIEGLDTDRLHFKILPVQNPYGYDHFTRQNARGVDLNRNFDHHWEELPEVQDVVVPWDYNYKGARPASEPETQIIQGIIDREQPRCVIDFHTADFIMMAPTNCDRELIEGIHGDIKARLRNRFIAQKPYGGAYQQWNMDALDFATVDCPYLVHYAGAAGVPASFLIEMSGNRDDTHGSVMVTDMVVEICLAAMHKCLAAGS